MLCTPPADDEVYAGRIWNLWSVNEEVVCGTRLFDRVQFHTTHSVWRNAQHAVAMEASEIKEVCIWSMDNEEYEVLHAMSEYLC